MKKGEFISEQGFKTLDTGRHLVKVSNIADDISESHGTEQMVVTLDEVDEEGEPTGKGSIRKWFNLQGYEKDPNNPKEYLLDDNEELIPSEENTAACKRIVGQFANRCGIPAGESFNRGDLMNKTVGIVVKPNTLTGSPEVTNFVEFEKMNAKLQSQTAGYTG